MNRTLLKETGVSMRPRDDIIQFGADHPGQLAAVRRWLRANGIEIPDEMTQPGSSVGDVVGILNSAFPGADPKHLGIVVRVLFGQAVERDKLVVVLGELHLRRRFAELKARIQGTGSDQDVHTEPNPLTMAPYWAELPEVTPPQGKCTFWDKGKAVDAITSAFPALVDEPFVCNEIARVLWGSIQGTAPEQFGELIATARRIQQHADTEAGTHMVVAPGVLGHERLLGNDEIGHLQEAPVDVEVTLDQEVPEVLRVDWDDDREWFEDPDEEPTAIIPKPPERKRRWLGPALLGLVTMFLVLLATWRVVEFLEFSDTVQQTSAAPVVPAEREAPAPEDPIVTEPINLSEVVEAAGAIIDPFDPSHKDALDLIKEPMPSLDPSTPLPCTDFKLLHGPSGGPGPSGCYAVGCQEGHAVPMLLVSGTWQACKSSTCIPKQDDCYIVTNKDRSTRSVAFTGSEWVDCR